MNTPTPDYDPTGTPEAKGPEAIARDLDKTRSNVNETLDALEARLSPGQILDRTLAFMRENGGEFVGNLGTAVKQNPVPTIVTGIGLAWLIAARSWGSSSARDRTRGTSEGIRETVSGAADSARERLADAAGTLSNKADAVKERVTGTAQAVTLQARRAREGFTQLLEEQPLVVGACALALGAFIGYSLPATETEDRWMGEARDRTVQRAKEAGAEQYAKAREFVADVTQSGEGTQTTHS
ncbi:MAG: Protein of uncharacterized function [Gammaproteobacteria bacterium]|nr:Protein of uncharacterized function [Gammaproteobacteria bacterium]